jgi:hypothetical protein
LWAQDHFNGVSCDRGERGIYRLFGRHLDSISGDRWTQGHPRRPPVNGLDILHSERRFFDDRHSKAKDCVAQGTGASEIGGR